MQWTKANNKKRLINRVFFIFKLSINYGQLEPPPPRSDYSNVLVNTLWLTLLLTPNCPLEPLPNCPLVLSPIAWIVPFFS